MTGLMFQGVEIKFDDPADLADRVYCIRPGVSVLDLWFPDAVTEAGHRLREMHGHYREIEHHEWCCT